ncbi:MAG: peptidoglycan recognition family protein [Elusimicrobiota bacterium]
MTSALFVLLLLALPARAGDLGSDVLFGGRGALEIPVRPGPASVTPVYESGESAFLAEPFDAVLFQGVSPASGLRRGDPAGPRGTGREEKDRGLRFELRRRVRGSWEAWRPAELHLYPGGRFWGKVRFETAAAGSVALRAFSGPTGTGGTVEVYALESFDTSLTEGEPKPQEVPAAVPSPSVVPPAVHGRAEWGAKPPKEPPTAHEPVAFTQHHTDGNRTETLEDSLREVRFIQEYHQNGRGWNDIGYHYLVDAAGRVFQGRPEGVVGSHVANHNTGNVGISLLGSYHPPKSHEFTAAQKDAIRRIGVWLRDGHGVSPDSYKGHRDYNPQTDCPGDGVYPLMSAIRESIRASPPATDVPPSQLRRFLREPLPPRFD